MIDGLKYAATLTGCASHFLHVVIFRTKCFLSHTAEPFLAIICLCSSSDIEIKMCCVDLQHGSSEGGADSAGRGSDSGCEFLIVALFPLCENESLI